MLPLDTVRESKRIISFIRSTVEETGMRQVVIGWSGGIDSTVCLYLLAQSLPKRNIHVLHLPYIQTFVPDWASVQSDIAIPSSNFHEISIQKITDTVWS